MGLGLVGITTELRTSRAVVRAGRQYALAFMFKALLLFIRANSPYDRGMKTILNLSCIAGLTIRVYLPACAAEAPSPFAGGRWIDLTHDFSSETIYWPTAQGFAIESEFRGVTEKGYFYAANRYRASEHGGTHIDAPIHFAEGRKTVDQLSIEQLTGAAVVVDVSAKAQKDADYLISATDLNAWESKHGEIPKGAILLINTGFARHWPDAKKYLGTDEKGTNGVAKL